MTLYNLFMNKMNQGQQPMQPDMKFMPVISQNMNPMQKMQRVMQAMQNPAAFVKQVFPDIPDSIQNDSSRVLQYLQQTRNISNEQIQNIMNQIPR